MCHLDPETAFRGFGDPGRYFRGHSEHCEPDSMSGRIGHRPTTNYSVHYHHYIYSSYLGHVLLGRQGAGFLAPILI